MQVTVVVPDLALADVAAWLTSQWANHAPLPVGVALSGYSLGNQCALIFAGLVAHASRQQQAAAIQATAVTQMEAIRTLTAADLGVDKLVPIALPVQVAGP